MRIAPCKRDVTNYYLTRAHTYPTRYCSKLDAIVCHVIGRGGCVVKPIFRALPLWKNMRVVYLYLIFACLRLRHLLS